jgi:SEC-C motif-containing protein
MACYCGKENDFEECCQPYLDGSAKPDTAETLMRSRYTAYVLHNIDYVVATHDPETADQLDRAGSEEWSRQAEWEGLDVLEAVDGGPDDDRGVVEFVARYRINGQPLTHHERSTFRRIDGHWAYIDGVIIKPKPVVREAPKIGRNQPCPCGSGMKYKKCHG